MDASEREVETRLIDARQEQDDLEAQRLRAAVEGALFGEPPVPIKIDRYVILDRLGSGGAGLVYSAYDPELDRRVALKLLRPAGGLGSSSTSDAKARLRREAQAMAQLAHPNVITVFDVGEVGDEVYIAMERIDGEDLATWMRRGAHPWREVRDRFVLAGRGLEAAHRAGLVHRDFKPSNVLVGADGRVCVLDFGLAKLARAEARAAAPDGREERASVPEVAKTTTTSTALTVTGAVMGTPAYMAPEQFAGGDVNARSDQYSFCLAMFEALYGVRPFAGDTADAIRLAKKEGILRALEPARLARAPSWLHEELLRGLRVDPLARHRDMASLLTALSRDPPAKRRRRIYGIIAGGTAAAAVAAAFAVGAQRSDVCTQANQELVGIWDPARRGEVERAFAATRRPFASSSLAHVLGELDGYAESWVRERAGLCEQIATGAGPRTQLLDRQVCLDQRLQEFAQLVELLSDADGGVVENSSRAVQTLSTLESCGDARPSGTVSADELRRIGELELALAKSDALRAAGRYEAALEVAQRVRERASAAELPRLRAAAEVQIGSLLDDMGQAARALDPLLEGISLAERHDDPQTVIRGLLSLVYIRGVSQADHEEGRRWGRLAQAKIERDGDATQEARLHNHLGVIANHADDQAACIEHLSRAIALREQLSGAELDLASSFNNLGNCHLSKGEHAIARDYFSRAYTVSVESLGPDHPDVAPPLGNMGISYLQEERWEDAEKALRASLDLFEKNFGRQHPRVAVALDALASTLEQRGDLVGALALHLEAVEIGAATMGEDHPLVGIAAANAAKIEAELGRADQAREHFARAISVLERSYGVDDPRVEEVRTAAEKALPGRTGG